MKATLLFFALSLFLSSCMLMMAGHGSGVGMCHHMGHEGMKMDSTMPKHAMSDSSTTHFDSARHSAMPDSTEAHIHQ